MSRTGTFALAVAGLAVAVAPTRPQSADPRAVDVALEALDTIERAWAIGDYDAADRVRAAINLRGGSADLTANLVVDRRRPGWRLDTAGGIGPLTFAVSDGTAILHVPELGQYATRPAGAWSASAVRASPGAAIAETRARLERGYDPLVHLGVETVDGSRSDRIRDTPVAGTTVDYWIDRETGLPRRVLVAEGTQEMRVDLRYGSGPRPGEVVVEVTGERPIRAVLSPSYDVRGRVKLLHADLRPASGPPLAVDLRIDWEPRVPRGFLAFSPPDEADRVAFHQLLRGVMFSAAGPLGALLSPAGGGP